MFNSDGYVNINEMKQYSLDDAKIWEQEKHERKLREGVVCCWCMWVCLNKKPKSSLSLPHPRLSSVFQQEKMEYT